MCLRSLSICQISGKFVWGLYISKCPIWTRYTPAPCPDRTLTFKNPQKLFIPPHMPGECSLVTYFTFSIAEVMVFRSYRPPRAYRSPKSSRKINDLMIIIDFSILSEMLTVFPDDKSACYRWFWSQKNILKWERGPLWCRLVYVETWILEALDTGRIDRGGDPLLQRDHSRLLQQGKWR